MNHFKNLKEYLHFHKLSPPEVFFNRTHSVEKKLPIKIPAGEWVSFGGTKQFIVFPYKPINSAMSGAVRSVEFLAYPELRQAFSWRWEYFHDRGDAEKIGKKDGLWIYDEDPILMPGPLITLIHYLIFRTQTHDFTNLTGESYHVEANF